MSKTRNLKNVTAKIKNQAKDMRQNIDSRLLELTSVSVDQVKTQWSKAAEKLDIDQNLPAYLVTRILEKAKSVRESIQSDENVGKAIDQAKVQKEKLQKQMVERALKAKENTRKKVEAVRTKAKAASKGIVKNSPLKTRTKKSKTPA